MKKLIFTILVCLSLSAAAETTPFKLVVPFPPGGGMDIAARTLAKHLEKSIDNPVIVDNRPGGNTSIGTNYVLHSRPDGHTLLITSVGTLMGSTSGMTTPLYDFQKDLRPVAVIAYHTPYVLVASPSKNYRNFVEFEQALKTNKLNYGTPQATGFHKVLGNMLMNTTSSQVQQIVYKGQSPLNQDLIGGVVDFTFATSYAVTGFINSGKLRVIAVADDKPINGLTAPTMKSLGHSSFTDLGEFYGVWASAETPDIVIRTLRAEIHKLAQGEMRKEFLNMNFSNPHYTVPKDIDVEQTRLVNRLNALNQQYNRQ
jgi:tripartite-type tricarboxylate transporter receptor subunit TctC